MFANLVDHHGRQKNKYAYLYAKNLAHREDTSHTSLDESLSGDSSHHSHLSSHQSSKNTVVSDSLVQEDEESPSHPIFAEKDENVLGIGANQQKRVFFSTIEIKEYAIIPGDNPAVTKGVPLTIDWIPSQPLSCSIDDYEKQLPTARSQMEICMPASQRYDLLRRNGFERFEIMNCSKHAAIIRNKRKGTASCYRLEPVLERFERMIRATKNATWNHSSKQKEKEWMKNSLSLTQPPVSTNPCLKGMTRTNSMGTKSTGDMTTHSGFQTLKSADPPFENIFPASDIPVECNSIDERAVSLTVSRVTRETQRRKSRRSKKGVVVKSKEHAVGEQQMERIIHNLRMILSSQKVGVRAEEIG
jgi:hypothetical protein